MAGFWGENFDGVGLGGVEPKRAFRFILTFGDSLMESWIVKNVKRPEFEITETEHQYLNHTFFYPAKVKWSTIDFTVVDPVNPDTTGAMMGYLHLAGYRYPGKSDVRNTIGKKNAVKGAGGVVSIQVIDEEGGNLEEWKLFNPWVSKVAFSELAYEKDDLTDATVTVRFDWATVVIAQDRMPASLATSTPIITAEVLAGNTPVAEPTAP